MLQNFIYNRFLYLYLRLYFPVIWLVTPTGLEVNLIACFVLLLLS